MTTETSSCEPWSLLPRSLVGTGGEWLFPVAGVPILRRPRRKCPGGSSQLQVAFETAQTAPPGLAETLGRQPRMYNAAHLRGRDSESLGPAVVMFAGAALVQC